MSKPKATVDDTFDTKKCTVCTGKDTGRTKFGTDGTPATRSARVQELHDAVVKAVDRLEEGKHKPTVLAIRDLIGSGSKTTLGPIIRDVLAERAKLKLAEISDQKYRSEFVEAAVSRASELLYAFENKEADRKVKQMQREFEILDAHTDALVQELCEDNRVKDEKIAELSAVITEKSAEIVKLQQKYDACRRDLEDSRRRLSQLGEKNADQMSKVLELLNELKAGGKSEKKKKSEV